MSDESTPHPPRYADPLGRYRLDTRVATGGMGVVWRGYDTVLNREVAVKVLKPEWADDATYRRRFGYEARHAAALRHPDIAAIYDVGESAPGELGEPPRPFLVMEFIDGRPLSELLGRPMDPTVVAALLATAADALGAAHAAGIIHRDVKPANLLVTKQRRLKVTDFGIARATDGVALTTAGQVLGTPSYLSPEQARGDRATPASDVYSLGVVAYEALSGVRPFVRDSAVATAVAHVRDTPAPLPASVPPALADVVERAMAKDPAQRYPDGAALAVALREAVGLPASGPVAAAMSAPPVSGADAPTQVTPAVVAPTVVDPTVVDPVVVDRGAGDPASAPQTQVLPVTSGTGNGTAGPAPLPTPYAEERGRSRVWPLVGVLTVILLIAGGALWLARGTRDQPVTPDPSSTVSSTDTASATPTTPGDVEIDEADYLGRPYADVVAELSGLGLKVSLHAVTPQAGEEQTPGTVRSVTPNGSLHVGDNVTVEYWGASSPSPSATPSSSSTPSASPTATPTDPPASSTPATPQESSTP